MRRAILIIDHGSRRAEANEQLAFVADEVRRLRPDVIVESAHMELAAPNLSAGVDACVRAGAEQIVVHPYFLGPGRHTTHDIPRLVAEARERHPNLMIEISAPLGLHSKIAM